MLYMFLEGEEQFAIAHKSKRKENINERVKRPAIAFKQEALDRHGALRVSILSTEQRPCLERSSWRKTIYSSRQVDETSCNGRRGYEMTFTITINLDEIGEGKVVSSNITSDIQQQKDKQTIKRHWGIDEGNSHLIGLDKSEFEKLLAMPEVESIKQSDKSIFRDGYYELIKRNPWILTKIRNEVKGNDI